jgi:hypothetical protein
MTELEKELIALLQAVVGDKPDPRGYCAASNVLDDALRQRIRDTLTRNG